ncbi:aminomethyltransferase family protein [Frigidibacter oleivorans]|uniref:aminomethyltransferase family protein n=1 Tax=Frigidibacter oleivorans TaxID=2487129 RepID=UPI000F8CFFD8|nr:aminomethyltransferase family protein [Frigidibacter oleivorans]
MALSWRFSALADRHRALGSALEDWSGMGTAWTYAKDIQEEHTAIRTKAGLMDVSGLKKMHLVGPHAIAVLDWITTRDMSKVTPGRSVYACLLNEKGFFTDDCIIYRTGPNAWMLVHGSGSAHEEVVKAAMGRNCAVLFDDDLHDLSLQGPVAVDYLARHVPGIRDLKYFHHMPATLFGAPVTISRTGYTGERGYEIFCRGQDAPLIWDTILSEGAEMGIVPCCFSVLDMLRVESYLLFYPYDNSQMYPFADEGPGDSLWELGLTFTVSPGKTAFKGAEEHFRLKGKERFRIFGLLLEADHACGLGDEVWAGDRRVGVVTCPSYSAITGQSMAIARLAPDCAVAGTPLTVKGAETFAAKAHELPFDDPKKLKRTAVG